MGDGTKRGALTELQAEGLKRLEACAREGEFYPFFTDG